jgi:hypothetical protein
MIFHTGLSVDVQSFLDLREQDLGRSSGKYLNLTRVRESEDRLYYVLSVGHEKQDLRELSFKLYAFIGESYQHINDLPFVERKLDQLKWTVCTYK